MTPDYQALANAGVRSLQSGDPLAARGAFDTIEAAGRGTPQLRLLLTRACIALRDHTAAHAALDHVLAEDPANLHALILRGDVLADAGDQRAAVSWYQAALAQAPRAGPHPDDLTKMLRHAATRCAESSAAFERHLDDRLAASGVDVPSVGARFAEALEILVGRMPVQLQQPTSFYYPRLEPRPFFERDQFSWVGKLEAEASAIAAELRGVLTDNSALSPYVTRDGNRPAKQHALLDDPNWSAFHLFREGSPIKENAGRCPVTMGALANVPMPSITGRSPMALFSVLKAGTHIPPHNGMLNTRLICHLPLVVPRDCRLRVGNETRVVEEGRMMIFDDSIEHEAWNDGDGTRVVLLFEIWRPELTPVEIQALTVVYEAIGAYAPAQQDQAGA